MPYFAGIDLGTSSVKVLVMDASGRPLGIGKSAYEVQIPQIGCAEQDPGEWWQSTKSAAGQALLQAGISPEKIMGIGFSGQMHGLVALDRDRNPVCPAMIHLDQRSAEERKEILSFAGDLMETELLNQPGAGMMICSLLWLKKHRPACYDEIKTVLLPKDYIRYRLTGVIGSDSTDASSTLAFSVRNNCWCRELIDRLGLKNDIWPEVSAPFDVVGKVSKIAAAETGFSPGTRVVAGGGDSAMALVGNGIVREGVMACNVGTASQIAAVVKKPLYDPKMRCQTWIHPVPHTWYVQGGTLNGGNTIGWLKNNILQSGASFAGLDREAASVPAGSEGLVFLPFLAGERTPFMNPAAKGVYFGLGLKHVRGHLFRAAMEGVSYNLYECAKIFREIGINSRKLIFSGGGAKSFLWKQIMADVLRQPVYTTMTEEEACTGAAMMAAVGTGWYGSVEEACDSVVKIAEKPVLPIAGHEKLYEEKQAVFEELYHNVKGTFSRL